MTLYDRLERRLDPGDVPATTSNTGTVGGVEGLPGGRVAWLAGGVEDFPHADARKLF